MSKWITTGQMIDELRVGETAESQEGTTVFCAKDGQIIHTTENFIPGDFVLTQTFRDLKWRILPRYVSFGEAMEALKEGNKVKFADKEFGSSVYSLNSPVQGLSSYSFGEMVNGKWTIEE